MKQNQNKVYSGWKANGFVALALVLVALFGGAVLAGFGGSEFPAYA